MCFLAVIARSFSPGPRVMTTLRPVTCSYPDGADSSSIRHRNTEVRGHGQWSGAPPPDVSRWPRNGGLPSAPLRPHPLSGATDDPMSAQDGVPRRSQDVRGQGEDLGVVIDQEDRFCGTRRFFARHPSLFSVHIGRSAPYEAMLMRSGSTPLVTR